MIKKFPLIFGLLLCAALVWGQNAGDMERLLDAREITCAEAAYFVLASRLEQPPRGPEAAFAMAREKGWLPENAESGGPVDLGGAARLFMGAFEIKGGLMYRLFPGRRYACREMVNQGFIEGPAYPNRKVSGEQFLGILGTVLSAFGDEETMDKGGLN
jgi:hypothetical protein